MLITGALIALVALIASIALFVKATDRLHNVRSLIEADEKFREKYIKETEEYYLDLHVPEIDIKKALEEIEKRTRD